MIDLSSAGDASASKTSNLRTFNLRLMKPPPSTTPMKVTMKEATRR
jgi:hypothetical protein